MDDLDQAYGDICSYVSAMGGEFRLGVNDEGNQTVTITHRGEVFALFPNGTGSHLIARSDHRLSNIPGFEMQESVPFDEFQSRSLEEVEEAIPPGNITAKPVGRQTREGAEYFDGWAFTRPLFVYEDSFDLREFDQDLSEVQSVAGRVWDRTMAHLSIDTDVDEQASNAVDGQRDEIAFQ